MAGTPQSAVRSGTASLLAALALVAAAAPLAQNRDDLESAWRQAAEAAQARRAERARRAAHERRLRWRSATAHARMPNTLHASTPSRPDADVSCPVPVETRERVLQEHRDALSRHDAWRVFDQPARAARAGGRHLGAGTGTRAGTLAAARPGGAAGHGAFAVSAASGAASGGANRHLVPLFTRASDPLRQGFARVVNRSDEAGDIVVVAVDDGGNRFGPVTLAVGAGATVHFNSADLENGNTGKGLSGAGRTDPASGTAARTCRPRLAIRVGKVSHLKRSGTGSITGGSSTLLPMFTAVAFTEAAMASGCAGWLPRCSWSLTCKRNHCHLSGALRNCLE